MSDKKITLKIDVLEWLVGNDTGISSYTIASAMLGIKVPKNDIPHDPDDFERCYRLLNKFPEWKKSLKKVAKKYPEWKPFVDNWEELEALYIEEASSKSAPKLYAAMQRLEEQSKMPHYCVPLSNFITPSDKSKY